MTRDKRTLAVHAGTRRSQFSEMSEAIYMTQGFAYGSAEAAEARFEQAGPDEFIYALWRFVTGLWATLNKPLKGFGL